jgi:hypothetical protein
MRLRGRLGLGLALAAACGGGQGSRPAGPPAPGAAAEPAGGAESPPANAAGATPAPLPPRAPRKPPSGAEARAYLELLAPLLVGRTLKAAESQALAEAGDDGRPALAKVLGDWKKDPGLVDTARMLISKFLATSGSREGIDFNLPGNIAATVARNDLPWSTVLTSETCYDSRGAKATCDTGAPYTAGVLTTRAFMASRIGRFNLTRASALLGTFACREYPMEPELEPRVAKDALITMFQAETETEQQDSRAANSFGNGFQCYGCHGQFSLHAQLFVKFDELGKYQARATGAQDPKGELGRSTGSLYASHFAKSEMAASEESQMFGEKVKNLGEAARVLARHDIFATCAARKLIEYTLGLDSGAEVKPELLEGIAARARRDGDPTFATLVFETFSDEDVVRTVVDSLSVEEPR